MTAVAPGRAVVRLTVRQVRRGALIVAAATAGMSAIVAGQYQTTFAGELNASAVRALAGNPAIRILFGPPVALDDPGGFTVWRTGTPVLVLAGVWALLTATRVTRGEEDAGRWDLLLAGRLRTTDLLVRQLTTLAGCALLIGTAVAAALLATDTDPAGAAVHAAAILGATLTYATAGLLAAQLLPSRPAAAGLTVGLLAAGLLLRMVADGLPWLSWASWLTPFGLAAHAAPYADNRVGPLLVLAAFPMLFATAALMTARRRDIGGAPLAMPTSRRPRTRLLGTRTGFAIRRAIRPTLGWATGIAAYYLLVGALITSILEFLRENPRFADLAATAGFGGLDTATGFAAAMFALVAIPAGLYAATRLTTLAADEKARRWTSLHATPVSRARLVIVEIMVTATGVVLLLVTGGLAVWTGAALTGDTSLPLSDALAGALNTAPVAWLALGAAALALGWLPPAVGAIGALPVAGGFLFDVVARSVAAPTWVVDLAPFAHLAPVPDTPPDWPATAALTAIAVALTVAGVAGYNRRDLTS